MTPLCPVVTELSWEENSLKTFHQGINLMQTKTIRIKDKYKTSKLVI